MKDLLTSSITSCSYSESIIVGVDTSTVALPEIVIVLPASPLNPTPGGNPEPLAFDELPLISNVIGVIAPFSLCLIQSWCSRGNS